MIDVSKLTSEELSLQLKWLRQYADIVKKIGKRGKKIFSEILSSQKSYRIEYFPWVTEDYLYEKAVQVYTKTFKITAPIKEDVVFVADENIWGWMRVYLGDNMVDMSFKRIENKLKM